MVGTPSVVSRAIELPRPPSRACLRLTESLPGSAHRSHPEAASPSVCQHAVGSASEPAPDTPTRLAARRASPDARCVGPTSAISLLRTSTRASLAPGSCASLRSLSPGDRLPSRQSDSLRRAAPGSSVHRDGRCLPFVACAVEPLAPLSRLPFWPPRSREGAAVGAELPRSHPRRVRVKDEARGMCDPRCLPSDKDHRPAAPFRAPGSGLRSRTAWPPMRERSTPFHQAGALASLGPVRPPSTCPVAAGTRFSGPWCRLPISAT